ncbi:MAG TPA: hypothetical protein VLV83_13100 [Acidobacteriota bacterium]|nr:hypothetical protein [Acidobacteriota bacterium]
MLDWIRNNAFFLALVTVLVAAVLLALRVGDSLDQSLASEPLEIRVEDPLAAMSALDPVTGEEMLLDYSSPRTILFILRGPT